MIRQMSDTSNNVILKLAGNTLNVVVTHCLTKNENGEINHSKCRGYYLDNYGFGYQLSCLCGCHREAEAAK